jgi:hypothetical protein
MIFMYFSIDIKGYSIEHYVIKLVSELQFIAKENVKLIIFHKIIGK